MAAKRLCILFLLSVFSVVFAFADSPPDPGFWESFKEGMKEDMTLIGLGMRAGLRTFIPGFSLAEDCLRGDLTWDSVENGSVEIALSASGQLKDMVKDPSHPLYKQAHNQLKLRNVKPKNLTSSSKRVFKFANGLGWILTGISAYEELHDATLLAMEYQKANGGGAPVRVAPSGAGASRNGGGPVGAVRPKPPAPIQSPDPVAPAALSGFHVKRAPAAKADFMVYLDKGNATITPNSNFSFGSMHLGLENRTKYHVAVCIIRVFCSVGTSSDVLFTNIPPGGRKKAEEPLMLVGGSVEKDFKSDPFLFPALIMAVGPDGKPVDLYETPDYPSVGFLKDY